jgi:hypothetical protein
MLTINLHYLLLSKKEVEGSTVDSYQVTLHIFLQKILMHYVFLSF